MVDSEDCALGCDDKPNPGIIDRLEDELQLTHRYEIVRRHIAMDVFSGILPLLGILMAGIIAAHAQESFLVFETTILAAVGTGIAHFFAGFSSAYLTETAEGKVLIEELEKQHVPLSHDRIVAIEHETTLLISVMNGIVPSGSVFITSIPMILSAAGVFPHLYLESMYASVGVGFLLLLIVGIYLGFIARDNIWIYVVRTMAAGGLTIFLLMIVSLITGA
ncbi:MAG: conserved membrane protein of unknown function [Candidatus Thorarchaeota archaeon]|nr:MAG: conserved membrane protein of unknown function [Candidatus Thorarchaeota archaeon]